MNQAADQYHLTATADELWQLLADFPLLDVRSPSEFAHAHVPGAFNLALFDDQERAEVGTIYKNSGHDAAVLRGLKYAGQKMADMVLQTQDVIKTFRSRTQASSSDRIEPENAESTLSRPEPLDPGKTVLVHCWRGGMRSQSVGWLLKTAGLNPIVIEGGYKSIRAGIREIFDRPWPLQVLSGLTGAGKTNVLHALAAAGEQVLDLEGLANHRGSAFGALGQPEQPSTEQFENDAFLALSQFDSKTRIWVEDEGNRIGSVVLPSNFYDRLRHSPGIFIDASPAQRVQNLLVDYGDFSTTELSESVHKITKRLGPQHAKAALEAIERNDVKLAIEIVLVYYDKFYLKAANTMPRDEMPKLKIDGMTDSAVAELLIQTLAKHGRAKAHA